MDHAHHSRGHYVLIMVMISDNQFKWFWPIPTILIIAIHRYSPLAGYHQRQQSHQVRPVESQPLSKFGYINLVRPGPHTNTTNNRRQHKQHISLTTNKNGTCCSVQGLWWAICLWSFNALRMEETVLVIVVIPAHHDCHKMVSATRYHHVVWAC
jgi:hypothetical protein